MKQNRPKKLVLNRETVRDLTHPELLDIGGGGGNTENPACYTATEGYDCYTTDPSVPDCHICIKC